MKLSAYQHTPIMMHTCRYTCTVCVGFMLCLIWVLYDYTSFVRNVRLQNDIRVQHCTMYCSSTVPTHQFASDHRNTWKLRNVGRLPLVGEVIIKVIHSMYMYMYLTDVCKSGLRLRFFWIGRSQVIWAHRSDMSVCSSVCQYTALSGKKRLWLAIV